MTKKKTVSLSPAEAINAVCPYYTMFPLDFPKRILKNYSDVKGWVVDPFCGRGTTNFAARLHGRATVGIDSSPIAVAVAEAKMCVSTTDRVMRSLQDIIEGEESTPEIPSGNFWKHMYHEKTLFEICKVRQSLLKNSHSSTRKILRAIVLGALHGPRTKVSPSYLSNQCPRTYAPKPDYSVRFWKKKRLVPPHMSIADVVKYRCERYLASRTPTVDNMIVSGDSRDSNTLPKIDVGLVITSPPYYGMTTYIQDQWLRAWFLGGPPVVKYKHPSSQMAHSSPGEFSDGLREVWRGLYEKARSDARMIIRFGGINSRKASHVHILKDSLRESGWRLQTMLRAGDANRGRRQAMQFGTGKEAPCQEHDFYAIRV